MPEIDLGPVIGPQGPKGDTGPQGEQGPQGPQGPAGKFDMDAGLTFSEASARANINSGESLKTILGKIKKYFTDLKPHAFKAPANNFTTTDATTAAAAPTVKQLKEDYDALNSALAYVKHSQGNFGQEGSVETYGNIIMEKRSNSKCDIHIQFGLPQVNPEGDSYIIFNMHLLKNLLGISSLTFDQSQAFLRPISQPLDSDYGENRCGMQINDTGQIGRYYYYDDGQQGWGSISCKNLIEAGFLVHDGKYEIDIWGATFS